METKTKKWPLNLLILLVLLMGAYLAYDYYFRLPLLPKAFQANEQTDPDQEDQAKDFRKFNILVLGLDGREGLNDRTDTIILASLDGENEIAQLLSIPRDTRVKIKGGWDKINAAYAYGGLKLTKQTVADFLEVDIDRYVIINFNGLIKMVDAVGGIEVKVPVRMHKPLEGIDLQPGLQHLNGKQVLAYSRFRGTKNGDIDRAHRQQEVLQILAAKVLKTYNPTRIAGLIEIARKEMKTDLTTKEMVALARLTAPVLENGLITEVLPGSNKMIDDIWYWEPDLSKLASHSLSFEENRKS